MYERTYSRPKPDGSRETWPETVSRVARGNLALVHGDDMDLWSDEVMREYHDLVAYMLDFRIIPAGRHLWATGAKGRQYLFNCHVAPWSGSLSRHFEFTFLRLMEGGGVGSNYSSSYLAPFGAPRRALRVHIVCHPEHPDYQLMLDAGLLSEEYSHEWSGAFQVEDSREGWANALTDLLDTYMTDDDVKHADRVYDVSNVRGKGAPLKTFGGVASGPEPFGRMMHKVALTMNGAERREPGDHLTPMEAMEIDHAIAECVVSGGNRRSARMAIVKWDDPLVFDFIESKSDPSKHWTTNISVEIDDAFIKQLDDSMSDASKVHAAVTEAMLANGEPGYWNSSYSNEGEPNLVIATNPCGEIALEGSENCNLGHINLDAFAPKQSHLSWNEGDLIRAHRLMARFLIRATYGDVNDAEQADILARNRRIGVGHLGVQGFLVKNGWQYSDVAVNALSPGYNAFRSLLVRLKASVDQACIEYAHDLRIPVPVKNTTVAPTGSIAKLPGVTEGIHPIYARYYEQRIRFSSADPDQLRKVMSDEAQGYGSEVDQYDPSGNTLIVVYPMKNILVEQVEAMGYPGEWVEQADEIPVGTMLAFQALYQTHWADNAVSFTINIPEGSTKRTVLADTLQNWLPKLKGTTIMPDGTRPQAPYTRITEDEYLKQATRIDEWAALIGDGVDEDCANGACPVR